MKATQVQLEALIRQTRLLETLRMASAVLGRMAQDQRPPCIAVTLTGTTEVIRGRK